MKTYVDGDLSRKSKNLTEAAMEVWKLNTPLEIVDASRKRHVSRTRQQNQAEPVSGKKFG